jgi:putative ABC transport system permease protein
VIFSVVDSIFINAFPFSDQSRVVHFFVHRLFPDRKPPAAELKATVRSLADVYTATSVKEMVYILTGAVLMLLMIACSSVANLLLARATARETELALRAGLGASRGRLMQLLAESFVLAGAGTAIGAVLAYAGLQWVRAAIPINGLPSEMEIRFSSEALLPTIGVTMVTTLLCGLVPALRAARGDLQGRLTSSGKGVSVSAGHGRLRTLLVAVQITLAIVLLVGAGLLMRTLIAIQQIDPGLDPGNVVVGQFGFPLDQEQTPAERTLFVRRVVEGVRTLPGVIAASPSRGVPLQFASSSPVAILGTTPTKKWSAAVELVGEDYFTVVRIPLLGGRLPSKADVDGARKVAVVNRRFVQEFLEGADPIRRMATFTAIDRAGDPKQPSLFEIVGVVGDTRNVGLQEEIRPQAFLPYTIPGQSVGAILLRTSVDPRAVLQGVRQQVWSVDPGVAVMNVGGIRGSMLLEDIVHRSYLAAPEFGVGLLSSFAAIGLILSAIGVFSVMAYSVSLQTHDIGIRMALGAEPAGVMREILLKGLQPIVAGVVVGVGASYGLTRVLSSHLYGVTATDPWTFTGVSVVLTAVGLMACALPARRAMRVDPLTALRYE